MSLGSRLLVLRAASLARRAARQRRRDLERELASYASPSDRCDLQATLDRYPDGVTHEIREILARQAWQRETRRHGFGGFAPPA